MFKNFCVVVSMMLDGDSVTAEFDKHSGRLRIFSGTEVTAEWFPPNSWLALATVAGPHHWGTNPTEEDLRLLIEDFAGRDAGR